MPSVLRKEFIILDTSRFGEGLEGDWRFAFFDKNRELITVSTSNKLTAVTQEQYKSWIKQDIYIELRPPSYEKFVTCKPLDEKDFIDVRDLVIAT
jgi:hypothetical protein